VEKEVIERVQGEERKKGLGRATTGEEDIIRRR
jgi:hypothetical protein